MPRVTIGMPTFNRGEFLKKSIPLVLNQSFADFEFIIYDDASIDNTQSIVASFNDPRIRYYRNEKNLKIPKNLNNILSKSTGEFIIFLHDHDQFKPHLIETLMDFLERNPEAGFVHPGIAFANEDGSNYEVMTSPGKGLISSEEFKQKMLMSKEFASPLSACSLVRRDMYEKTGFFYDEKYGFFSDVDLWLRMMDICNFGLIQEPLITCTRRNDEHFCNQPNFELIQRICSIFGDHLNLAWPEGGAEFKQAHFHWKKMRNKLYRRHCLSSGALASYDQFYLGIEALHAHGGILTRLIMTPIYHFKFIRVVLVNCLISLKSMKQIVMER
jgi:glycosyltransferase involved in cell wall biosynthesis